MTQLSTSTVVVSTLTATDIGSSGGGSRRDTTRGETREEDNCRSARPGFDRGRQPDPPEKSAALASASSAIPAKSSKPFDRANNEEDGLLLHQFGAPGNFYDSAGAISETGAIDSGSVQSHRMESVG